MKNIFIEKNNVWICQKKLTNTIKYVAKCIYIVSKIIQKFTILPSEWPSSKKDQKNYFHIFILTLYTINTKLTAILPDLFKRSSSTRHLKEKSKWIIYLWCQTLHMFYRYTNLVKWCMEDYHTSSRRCCLERHHNTLDSPESCKPKENHYF